MAADARLPLVVIAGFLGSGKTSCVEWLARQPDKRGWAWVVNDFGDYDVDGRRLAAAGLEAVSVAGGSILCGCLGERFAGVMRSAVERHRAGEIDVLAMEVSGIARPSGVTGLLRDHNLTGVVRPAAVITLIDPGTVFLLKPHLAAVDDQIDSATHLVVNKQDLAAPGQVAAAVAALAAQNPSAEIVVTSGGRIGFSLEPADISGRFEEKAAMTLPDPDFPRFSTRHDMPVDMGALAGELGAVAVFMHRAKGMLKGGDGCWWHVDVTPPGTVSMVRVNGMPPDGGGFVAIARHDTPGPAQNLVRSLVDGRFSPE